MSDRLAAVLRTGRSLAVGLRAGVPDAAQRAHSGQALDAAPVGVQLAELVVIAAAIGIYYVAVRWLEPQPWMPRWIVRLLISSAKQPACLATSR